MGHMVGLLISFLGLYAIGMGLVAWVTNDSEERDE